MTIALKKLGSSDSLNSRNLQCDLAEARVTPGKDGGYLKNKHEREMLEFSPPFFEFLQSTDAKVDIATRRDVRPRTVEIGA